MALVRGQDHVGCWENSGQTRTISGRKKKRVGCALECGKWCTSRVAGPFTLSIASIRSSLFMAGQWGEVKEN